MPKMEDFMKTKFLSLLTLPTIISTLLFQGFAYSSELPPETAIFKLPNNDYCKWVEITRLVNEHEGIIERIPSDQTLENWTSLISIQYMALPSDNKLPPEALEEIVDLIRKVSTSKYPSNMVTWNIIEKNKNDIIYEWILSEPYKNIPPQHEITRAFITKRGFHRVGIARKNMKMSQEERGYWVKQLKESSVKSYAEALKSQGFSLTPMLYEKTGF
jgi:hypothetical protein